MKKLASALGAAGADEAAKGGTATRVPATAPKSLADSQIPVSLLCRPSNSLISVQKFRVLLFREFCSKYLNLLTCAAGKITIGGPNSIKFPVDFPVTRETKNQKPRPLDETRPIRICKTGGPASSLVARKYRK
jgi:hypothetical protein